MAAFKKERSGESGYNIMPRNVYELKNGGTIAMLSPGLRALSNPED